MENTKKIVLSGILCAVALVLLFISSVSFVLDYTILLLASLVILVAVIEMSPLWATLIYIAVSLLSLVLIPFRDTKILFIFFIGYYPVLKSVIEKQKNRIFEYVLKLAVFNITVGLCVYLFQSLFFTKEDIFTPIIIAGIAVAINVTFILYDIALSRIAMYYIFKIKPRIKFIKK